MHRTTRTTPPDPCLFPGIILILLVVLLPNPTITSTKVNLNRVLEKTSSNSSDSNSSSNNKNSLDEVQTTSENPQITFHSLPVTDVPYIDKDTAQDTAYLVSKISEERSSNAGKEKTPIPDIISRQAYTAQLQTLLFNQYSNSIRPTAPNSTDDFEATRVKLRIVVEGIEDVSTNQQTMTTRFIMSCSWMDANLVWNASQFGNTSKMMVKQIEVWKPDLVVGNSVNDAKKVGFPELPVMLKHTGEVTWGPSIITTTTCEFNIVYYPFDSQLCTIRLQTAASPKEDVDVFLSNDNLTFDSMTRNGQWELIGTQVTKNEDKRSSYEIYFRLRRRPNYDIFTTLLPAFALSSLASLTFTLPVESGDKISLSVTVLLTYSVNLATVASILPETSLQIAVFMIYLASLMFLSVVSIILSACVLKAYYTPDSTPVNKAAIFTYKMLTGSVTTMTKSKVSKHHGKCKHNEVYPVELVDTRRTGNEMDFGTCPDILGFELRRANNFFDDNDNIMENDKSHEMRSGKQQAYSKEFGVEGEEKITWKDVSHAWNGLLFKVFTVLVVLVNIVFIWIIAMGERLRPVSSLPESGM